MTKEKYNVAVVGATGLVGREMISILEERDFPVDRLIPIASERSVDEVVSYKGLDYAIAVLNPDIFEDVDIALFSAGGDISKEFGPIAAKKGAVVIDNSSTFRMDPDVPLVVPEVNPNDVEDFEKKKIIANPNCSTIQLVAVLAPLHKKYKIKRVVVSTYQAVSGAGKKAIAELSSQVQSLYNQKEMEVDVFPHQIAFNAIPHIDVFEDDGYSKEERKMINETKKILGDSSVRVTATTVRIPVFCSHSESVNIEFEKPVDLLEVRKLLSGASGVEVVDDLSNNEYPLAVNSTGRDEVFVGRIRKDSSVENGIDCWVVSDNLRKGAALNAVQIAEVLTKKYLNKI